MPSVQSQIIAKAVTLLTDSGAAPAYRTRMQPFTAAQLPAFNVLPDAGDADYSESYSGSVDWKFKFNVRCMAVTVDEVDVACDVLYVAACQAILADITMGGLCTGVRVLGVKWDREAKGEYDSCAQVITFEAEFSAARNDPSVQMP